MHLKEQHRITGRRERNRDNKEKRKAERQIEVR